MPSATPRDVGPPLPRAQFPVAERSAYLDTAYASPLPRVAVEQLVADAHDAANRGSRALDERAARLPPLRSAVADVLGVAHADVALVPNTAHGLGALAGGLDWQPGDRVVVRADDHPTTTLPWRVQAHRGVEVVDLAAVGGPGLLAAVEEALARGRVRVVALSWVDAGHGARVDLAPLAELVHAHGALLCVDAIQGAGVVPAAMAEWGVDLAAAGSQKWLLGPHGIGAVAVRPEVAERLTVPTASEGTLVGARRHGGEPVLPGTARRVEAGAAPLGAAAAWTASLGLLTDAGIPAVWAWADHLATQVVERARALGLVVRSDRTAPARSSVVALEVPGLDATDAVARLRAADVVVSARAGGIRVAPAGWNDESDVDALVAALAAL